MCCIPNVNIAQAAADMPRRHTALSGVRKSAHRERMRERGMANRTGHRRNETQRGGRLECELLTVSLQQATVVIQRELHSLFLQQLTLGAAI